MRNFMQKFMNFMQGRYGSDSLNKFLFGSLIVMMIIRIFLSVPARFSFTVWIIQFALFLLELAILSFLAFRFLSRNINKRSLENRQFLKLWTPVKAWFKLTVQKFKDRKEYRYLKCPVCKSQLRVKNKKGVHTIRCPRCKSEFNKKI